MFEKIVQRLNWRWFTYITASILIFTGAATAPMAFELLPPTQLLAYQRILGVSPPVDQKDEMGEMPLHYALRFGWPELVSSVKSVYAQLSDAERERAIILSETFGDTGALNFYGPELGLPRAVSGHNNYWLWKPEKVDNNVVIVVTETDEKLNRWFKDVKRVAEIDCEYCMPYIDKLGIYVCRQLKYPFAQWWDEVKHYQ